MASAVQNMRQVIGFDKRSLAMFRVFIALTTAGDILNRW
jgi:hypothetical protein